MIFIIQIKINHAEYQYFQKYFFGYIYYIGKNKNNTHRWHGVVCVLL